MSIEEDTRLTLIVVAADKLAADQIYGLLGDLLEGDDGLVTLSASAADRPYLERALTAARGRSPKKILKRRRLRLLR